jgi:glyoxylase-like metal-dependent hydrolase (beta-lactamase superfamily II)
MAFPFETPVEGVGMVAVPASGITTNIFALGAGDDYLLVDAGTESAAPEIIETLELAGYAAGRGRAVIPTHGHLDHYGGAARLSAWAGAPVWAHPATAVEVEDHWGQFVEHGDAGRSTAPGSWKDFLEWAGPDVRVARLLREGEEVELPGGGKLEVLHCPGHHRGLVTLHDAERRLAFCGDLVQGGWNSSANWLGLVADPERQKRSLERVGGLGLEWLFKGHREPVSGEAVKRDLEAALARLVKIRAAVLEFLAKKSPATLAEITRAAFRAVLNMEVSDARPYALATVGGFLAESGRAGLVTRDAELGWSRAGE